MSVIVLGFKMVDNRIPNRGVVKIYFKDTQPKPPAKKNVARTNSKKADDLSLVVEMWWLTWFKALDSIVLTYALEAGILGQ